MRLSVGPIYRERCENMFGKTRGRGGGGSRQVVYYASHVEKGKKNQTRGQ